MSQSTMSQTHTGKVINSSMEKTIAVVIERVVPHPLYGKYIKRSTKLLAHDEQNISKIGDVVLVSSCKPISKRKVWKLEKVLGSAA
jgi:small subunit ribosomal protein S17